MLTEPGPVFILNTHQSSRRESTTCCVLGVVRNTEAILPGLRAPGTHGGGRGKGEGKVRAKALGGLCYSYYGPDMTESTLFLFFVVEV